ncbi:MAG: hypothetical protein RBR63_01645 [Methanosarcina vacuolata]|nr:hypothetical protein [Methanosarcina vacuolata]
MGPELISTSEGFVQSNGILSDLWPTAFSDPHCLGFGKCSPFADTVHNFGDAATAVPLGIAFLFSGKKPDKHFTYVSGHLGPDWIIRLQIS